METRELSHILSPIITIPQFSNQPKNKKFSNFLNSKIETDSTWPSCHKDLQALEVNDEIIINKTKCIGCLNCLTSKSNFSQLNSEEKDNLWQLLFEDNCWSSNNIEIKNIFNGNRIELPRYNSFHRKYSSFEEYTMINEVEHIAMWGATTLKFLSSQTSVVGREIEIFQSDFPRDGRLDICAKCNSQVLVMEAKTDFNSMISENRFKQQIPKYNIECQKIIDEEFASEHLEFYLSLLVGGSETDLYPPQHKDCTSIVGDKAKKFYDDIEKNQIRFVSANALWVLGINGIFSDSKICWDLLFPKIFSDSSVIGMITEGLIKKQDLDFIIEPISQKVLESAMISH